MPNLDKVIASMFGLILVFLILSRSGEFNSVVNAIGGFVTSQTAQLQGVTSTGQTIIAGSTYTGL